MDSKIHAPTKGGKLGGDGDGNGDAWASRTGSSVRRARQCPVPLRFAPFPAMCARGLPGVTLPRSRNNVMHVLLQCCCSALPLSSGRAGRTRAGHEAGR